MNPVRWREDVLPISMAIDLFMRDWRSEGRINSENTEIRYRYILGKHCDDARNRPLANADTEDVKRTLRRWKHANSQSQARSVLSSFYMWARQEGHIAANPVEGTRQPKRRAPKQVRLTRDEAEGMLAAARTPTEQRAMGLMYLHGLRVSEAITMTGDHLRRDGFLRVVGKGNKERWVPVHPRWRDTYEALYDELDDDTHLLPSKRWADPGVNSVQVANRTQPMSRESLTKYVTRLAARSGIPFTVTPHVLRRAFAMHVCAGLDLALIQALMGHASPGTTARYTDGVSLDLLQARFGAEN